MRLRHLLIAIVAFSLPLCAQTTKKTDGKPPVQKIAAPAPAQAKPSPEIQKLATTLVGRWKVSGKILDPQWAPNGSEGSGTEIVRRGPGNYSLISDSRMDFTRMGNFSGHGVTYWDAAKGAYTGIWCDTWNPLCDSIGLGKWEGDNLVFTGEMQAGPQTVPMRQTYSNITKDGFDWLMEAGDGKGGWKPEMSLKYRRIESTGPGSPTGLAVQPK